MSYPYDIDVAFGSEIATPDTVSKVPESLSTGGSVPVPSPEPEPDPDPGE